MKLLMDGRVFSTGAHDRGMGRYVLHLIDVLDQAGHEVTLLLFRNCWLQPDDPVVVNHALRYADYDPADMPAEPSVRLRSQHEFTAELSALIEADAFELYLDSTPFIGPVRLDLFLCPVIAVCYDLIPLKHSESYLGHELVRRTYYNGLARLAKADFVVCISETVQQEVSRYLGIAGDKLCTISPTLDQRYLAPLADHLPLPHQSGYLFGFLGAHRSKNPEVVLSICKQLLRLHRFTIRLNAPTPDQAQHLRATYAIPPDIELSTSISEDEKYGLQRNARINVHLSIEEGFGIPLLEALFVGTKIVALDVPINREMFNRAGSGLQEAVFLIEPTAEEVDLAAFVRFLNTPVEAGFYQAIRSSYIEHWSRAPSLMKDALASARQNFEAWVEDVQFKIFSSIPGTSCGVADYSVAYARSADGNVSFFFSEGEPENISYLSNVRAFTHLDFERFTRSRLSCVPGLFNFAFSPALNPGIDLMRRCATARDVVLIHERRYLDGLRQMLTDQRKTGDFITDYAEAESPERRTELARYCIFHHAFNKHTGRPPIASPITSAWLRAIPARKVSHLSEPVIREMARLSNSGPGAVMNDLEPIEDQLDFVPLGIDDRRHPGLLRSGKQLRLHRGIQQDDLVIGHFGLILDDLKRLGDAAAAFVQHAEAERNRPDGRRMFFFLVGKIVDRALFDRICADFAAAGLEDRLVHSNPELETDFDAEIAACDAVICFRKQSRGQVSHILVRALSLGSPVIVNEASGYGYDPRTTVADDDLARGLAAALTHVADPETQVLMRQRAREQYDRSHRGDSSLAAMLSHTAQ